MLQANPRIHPDFSWTRISLGDCPQFTLPFVLTLFYLVFFVCRLTKHPFIPHKKTYFYLYVPKLCEFFVTQFYFFCFGRSISLIERCVDWEGHWMVTSRSASLMSSHSTYGPSGWLRIWSGVKIDST